MNTTLLLLQQGRALLADPGHWTQGVSARTKSGDSTPPDSPLACSWCSTGAVAKITKSIAYRSALYHHLELAIFGIHPEQKHFDGVNIVLFNDSHSHSEVLAVWDKAIENANR